MLKSCFYSVGDASAWWLVYIWYSNDWSKAHKENQISVIVLVYDGWSIFDVLMIDLKHTSKTRLVYSGGIWGLVYIWCSNDWSKAHKQNQISV